MQMPAVPEEIFIEGMRQLIELDKNWIPAKEDHSLIYPAIHVCNG